MSEGVPVWSSAKSTDGLPEKPGTKSWLAPCEGDFWGSLPCTSLLPVQGERPQNEPFPALTGVGKACDSVPGAGLQGKQWYPSGPGP